ncbi:MAG: sensor histidine kinase, partial [Bacteroidota bacterium]
SYLADTYIQKTLEFNHSLMRQINYIRGNREAWSDRILSNNTIQTLLKKSYSASPSMEKSNDKNIVESFLLAEPTNLLYAVIVGENGVIYDNGSTGLSNTWNYVPIVYQQIIATRAYKKCLTSEGNNLWLATNEDIRRLNHRPYLYLCRTLIEVGGRFRKLGQLIIQMPLTELDEVFGRIKLENGEYYAIIADDGRYLYHTAEQKLIGAPAAKNILQIMAGQAEGYRIVTEGREKWLVTYANFGGNGWNVLHLLPMKVIAANAGKVRNYILLILLLTLIISLPLLVFLSGDISRPIRKLKSTVEQFGNGNLAARAVTDRMDEIGHLQASFNTMADEITNLLEKNAIEHKQRRLLELNMIEYQINPHFLYNVLDSINWMAQKAGNEDIEEMVSALAKFLRVGLSKGKELYKIRDELEHVRQYLLINKIRFKNSFCFEILAEPEVLDYSTIKIILQPIVENAIKYGITKTGTAGLITVTAEKEADAILFTVRDNGPGIPQDRLQAIQHVLAQHAPIDEDSSNGFGLFNVSQRVWLHFGEGYGVTIDSRAGSGTTVSIRIPQLP